MAAAALAAIEKTQEGAGASATVRATGLLFSVSFRWAGNWITGPVFGSVVPIIIGGIPISRLLSKKQALSARDHTLLPHHFPAVAGQPARACDLPDRAHNEQAGSGAHLVACDWWMNRNSQIPSPAFADRLEP